MSYKEGDILVAKTLTRGYKKGSRVMVLNALTIDRYYTIIATKTPATTRVVMFTEEELDELFVPCFFQKLKELLT